jgi:hypothetical protein
MAEFILISVPVDDFDKLGVREDSIIEMFVNDRNELIIRAIDMPDDVVFVQDPGSITDICAHSHIGNRRTSVIGPGHRASQEVLSEGRTCDAKNN